VSDIRPRHRQLAAVVVVAALGCIVRAQEQAPAFRSQAHLVVVQATVLDRRAMHVPDLTQQQFQIYEDGARQDIRFFVSDDDPVAVGLVVDNSTSMWNKREAVAAAADAFAESSHSEDALFTMNFNERAWLGLPAEMAFTSDRSVLRETLAGLRARGTTAMYDGIAAALDHVAGSPLERHVLIVVSDGGDNGSTMNLERLLDRIRRTNTVIYAVGVFDEVRGGDKKALRSIAAASGGAALFPATPQATRAALEQVARDIRQSYRLGYVSTNARLDGTYRKVAVVAIDKSSHPLTVRAREGYRAPSADDRH